MSAAETLTESNDDEYPRNWRWDEDGDTVEGLFVGFDEGPTAYGDRPILVLHVDGEARNIWLLETALRARLADEVAKRPTRDLTAGEQVQIHRGEVVTSGTGRDYRSFKVRFPDRPKRKATDILGAPTEPPKTDPEPAEDDPLPF
jgi:hypothetical protein